MVTDSKGKTLLSVAYSGNKERKMADKEQEQRIKELEQRVKELEKEVGYLRSVFDELVLYKEKLDDLENKR